MYEFREDIFDMFERQEDDERYGGLESPAMSPRTSESSSSTSLSYSMFTPSTTYDSDDEIYFPSYDVKDEECVPQVESLKPSVKIEESPPIPDVPSPVERSEDDTDARIQPSRHVDYLSHDWSEEELWSSYKFLVSKRKVYPNSARLENACWRTWEKKRRDLETVSPETVKWYVLPTTALTTP